MFRNMFCDLSVLSNCLWCERPSQIARDALMVRLSPIVMPISAFVADNW